MCCVAKVIEQKETGSGVKIPARDLASVLVHLPASCSRAFTYAITNWLNFHDYVFWREQEIVELSVGARLSEITDRPERTIEARGMASTAEAIDRTEVTYANDAQDEGPVQRPTSILAAGSNAHHQLFSRDGDVRSFSNVIDSPARPAVLFSGWSTTVLQTGQVFSIGNQDYPPSCSAPLTFPGVQLRSAFGDHNGLVGCLDDQGRLYLVDEPQESDTKMPLICTSGESSPLIGAIALAQNGRIALSFKQAPNGRLCHVVEFDSVETFKSWFEDPSAEQNYPPNHYMLPGRPRQLVANHGIFVLLMESGEVYSWGDARYQSLARPVTGEGSLPADKPGTVEALGGLRISKVASGGWLSAALSQDGALYIWGSTAPGSAESLHALESAVPGEVALVELPTESGEAPDVLDVAVGDNHIAVIAEDHRLCVTGDNRHGQLGLASDQPWFTGWEIAMTLKNEELSGPVSISAGPQATFVTVV